MALVLVDLMEIVRTLFPHDSFAGEDLVAVQGTRQLPEADYVVPVFPHAFGKVSHDSSRISV